MLAKPITRLGGGGSPFKGEALNISYFLKGADKVRPLFTNVDNKKISGGLCPPLREQRMLRALPLKPMRDSVPQPCKLLKKLEQNF
ncbi:hypothetical protein [Pseudoruminococcus massiliensis]|uniref:hypothetical protein n=1 Tax=Pseudoruminococcus massiliensis TaxID=2086583 RepID=UPI000D0EDC32|nr:hypothetical protein [Pseudoruminococcus massiliensis]